MKSSHPNQEFSYQFKKICRQAKLSQKELAKKTGLSLGTIKGLAQGRKSTTTERAVVEAINEKLGKAHRITAMELFRDWVELPAESRVKPEPRRAKIFTPEELPDLLTPGVPPAQLQRFYSRHLGADLAGKLATYSRDAIAAVESGNFEQQVKLGKVIAEAGEEFPQLLAVGKYFTGEGLRLLGDIAVGQNERERYYRDAALSYHEAVQANEGDPRPLRGLARIEERKENLDKAEYGFEEAEALTMLLKVKTASGAASFYLQHELLRVMRHKIHCLLAIRARNRASKWNSVRKTSELFGLVIRADNAHRELMGSFADQPRWSQIEWFMGWVFLAKAWGSLQQRDQLYLALLHGLAARRTLLRRNAPLDNVERMNLNWWIEVALSFRSLLDSKFTQAVERMKGALSINQNEEVLRLIDGLVQGIHPYQGPEVCIFDFS